MNNLETRRNKINSCMAELFNLYMEDRKNIKGSISLDGVKCTLNFGETSNDKVADKKEINEKKVTTIEDLRGIVIRCKTKKESNKFLRIIDKLGIEWDGASPCNKERLNAWYQYEDRTCYIIFGISGFGYCNDVYFKSDGYTIKSAKWFFDNFKPKE